MFPQIQNKEQNTYWRYEEKSPPQKLFEISIAPINNIDN